MLSPARDDEDGQEQGAPPDCAPARSPESGDDRSPHSVSGSNRHHGIEGGRDGNTDCGL